MQECGSFEYSRISELSSQCCVKSPFCRYGYGERVQQDESFADLILQRVAMLQYSSLLNLISKSPELQSLVPDLVPAYGRQFRFLTRLNSMGGVM